MDILIFFIVSLCLAVWLGAKNNNLNTWLTIWGVLMVFGFFTLMVCMII